jgi:limonene-1,2-epoxide hydrolase
MKTSVLEYSKIILTKVSFCEALFEKELKKAVRMLSDKDRFYLQLWCNTHFSATFGRSINKCFKSRFLLHSRNNRLNNQ